MLLIRVDAIDRLTAPLYFSIGLALEASAHPKPGNVHRTADLADMRFEDFIVTSVASVPVFSTAVSRGRRGLGGRKVTIGDLVYRLVSLSTALHGGGNTCLGSALLTMPLAVCLGHLMRRGVAEVPLHGFLAEASRLVRVYSTVADAVYLYRAVRLVRPSYVRRGDETGGPPDVYDRAYRKKLEEGGFTLWEVLVASAPRDVVAREVIEGYPLTMEVAEELAESHRSLDWNAAVVNAFLKLLERGIDTQVLREHGRDTLRRVARMAQSALRAGGAATRDGMGEIARMDRWMRGRGVNPGSSADILAAAIGVYALSRVLNVVR